MFVDRSRGTWQISADALDCLSHQINQDCVTVTEPFFYRALLLYFMLSSLLFSSKQGTNLFHQWFSCWPCRLVYLQPPLNPPSYEVIASWGETWGNNTVIGTRSVIGKIIVQMTWHLLPKKKKKKAQRGASSQKFSLQTAFKEKNDDLVFKSTLF